MGAEKLSALVGRKFDQMVAGGFAFAAVEAFVERVAEFLLPGDFELVVENTALWERTQAFVEVEADRRPY